MYKAYLVIFIGTLLCGAIHAQEYSMIGTQSSGRTIHASSLTGDSTLLFDPASNYLIKGIAIVIDSAWRASDSIKIGTSGWCAQRPGNLYASDTAAVNAYTKTWMFRESWDASKKPIYLYHSGLSGASGSLKIYVWTVPVEADSSTMFMHMGWWNDLIGTANNLRANPLTAYPEYNYTNLGYMFRNAQSDTLYILMQMDHGYVQGSRLYPHVHWLQTDTGKVVWKMRWKLINVAGTEPAWSDTSGYTGIKTYVSGNIHQLTPLASIMGSPDGEIPAALSFIIEIKLVRLGTHPQDTYQGPALLKAFDIHYLKDSPGSQQEYLRR